MDATCSGIYTYKVGSAEYKVGSAVYYREGSHEVWEGMSSFHPALHDGTCSETSTAKLILSKDIGQLTSIY